MRKQGSVYWHVGNSGVTFEVVDEGHGPMFVARSGAFGNLKSTFEAKTDEFSLRMLGLMLLNAADRRYSEVYTHPASLALPRSKSDDGGHESWDGKSPIKKKPTPPPRKPLKETLGFLLKEDPEDTPPLSLAESAFAILTVSAVFARVSHIDANNEDVFEWFPNLTYRHLGWLWQNGFFTEPQIGILGWNPKVELFTPGATGPKEQTWAEAIHDAVDLTRRMPVVGGPTPRDMGGPDYPPMPLPPVPLPASSRPRQDNTRRTQDRSGRSQRR